MREESIYQIINKAEYTNLVVDSDHIIRFFNEYSYNYIKKHTNIEIKNGFPIHDFLAPYNVERFKAAFTKSFRGETVNIEIHFEKENGEFLYFEAIFTPLTEENGTVTYTSVRLIELTGLKRLLKALEQSEQRNKGFVGLSTSLVARILLDGTVIYVNDSCCELFGKSCDEFLGKNFLSFIHPDDNGFVNEKVISTVTKGTSGIIEARMITNFGIKWAGFECAAIKNENGVIDEIQAVGWDLTDSKNALHELIHTKYRLGTILDNFSNILLYELGREDGFVSPKIYDMLGYDASRFGNTNFLTDIILGEDLDEFLRTFNEWKGKENPGILKQNFRCVKSSGGLLWVENLMIKAADSKGVFYCGVLQDVTERIKHEETTSRNEALFRMIGESARIGYYVVNYFTDEIVYINRKFCELWGIEPGPVENNKLNIRNSYVRDLCSEQVEKKEEFMENSLNYSIPQNDISFEDEMKLKNGRVLRRFSSVINDNSGNYLGRYYMVEDITERVLFEKTIKSHNDYKTLVEEAAAGIIIADSSAKIININNTACVLLGYTKKEIIGKHLVDFIYDPELIRNPPKFTEAGEGKTIISKRYIKKKDGGMVFVESHSKMLPNGLVQAIIWEIKEETENPPTANIGNSFSTVLAKVKAFRHGESSLMCLNRISLFLKNKSYLESSIDDPAADENKKLFERFELLLSEYILTVYPQLEFISANVNLILKDMPKISVYNDVSVSNEKLILNSRMLKHKLVELQMGIREHGGISGAEVDSELIVELARVCITNIKLIAKILEDNFVTDVRSVIENVLKIYVRDSDTVRFNASFPDENHRVIINEVELIEIINILVNNSVEAFKSSGNAVNTMLVDFRLDSLGESLVLEYSDSGPGLPERMKEIMFRKGATTKGKGRGFGLYYADSILNKYGGTLKYVPEYFPGAKFVLTFNKV